MDSDEAVDYAGSDADDVISLGGVDQDEQPQQAPPSEPQPEPEPSQPAASVSVPHESTSDHLEQAEPSRSAEQQQQQQEEEQPPVISRDEPKPRQQSGDASRPSPRAERRHRSTRKEFKDTEDEHGPLPRGWTRKTSKSTGQVYYYNLDTDASAWERPAEPVRPAPHRERDSKSSRRGSKRGDTWRPSPVPAPADLPPRRDPEPLSHQSLPPKPRPGGSEARRGPPPSERAGSSGQELDRIRQERLQALDQSEPRRRSAAPITTTTTAAAATNRQGAGPDRGYPPAVPPTTSSREELPPAAAPSMYPDRDRSRSYRGSGEQADRRPRYPSPPPAVSGYDARRRPRSPLSSAAAPPPPHKMARGSSWSAAAEPPAEPFPPPARERGYFAGATVLESASPAPQPPVAAENDMYASRRRAMADSQAAPGDTYRPSAGAPSRPPPAQRVRDRRRRSPSPPPAAPRYHRPAEAEPQREEPPPAAAPAAPAGVHPSRLKLIQKAHPEPKPQAPPSRPRSPPTGPRARQSPSSNRVDVPSRPDSRGEPPREPAAHRRVSRWGVQREHSPENPAREAWGSSATAVGQEPWQSRQATTSAADESWDLPTEPAADRSFETMPRLSTARTSQDADAQAPREQDESPVVQPPPNSVSNEKDGSDQREVAEEPPGEETQRGADEPEPVGEESSVEHQNEARPRGDFAIQDEQDEGPAAPPAPKPLSQDPLPLPASPAATSLGSRIAETRAHEGRKSNGSSRSSKQRGRRRSRTPPPRDESTSASNERRTFEIAGRAKQEADRTGTGRQPSLKDRMPSTSLPLKPGSVEPPTAPSGSLLARLGPSHGDSRPGSPDVAPKRARSRSPGPGHGYGPRNGPLPPQDESGAPAPPRKFRRHGGRRSRR